MYIQMSLGKVQFLRKQTYVLLILRDGLYKTAQVHFWALLKVVEREILTVIKSFLAELKFSALCRIHANLRIIYRAVENKSDNFLIADSSIVHCWNCV